MAFQYKFIVRLAMWLILAIKFQCVILNAFMLILTNLATCCLTIKLNGILVEIHLSLGNMADIPINQGYTFSISKFHSYPDSNIQTYLYIFMHIFYINSSYNIILSIMFGIYSHM